MSTGNSQVKGIRSAKTPAKTLAKTPAKTPAEVWVLSVFFSPYKAVEYSFESCCFASKKLAQEAMRIEARRLYKNSDIIQEAEDKYYREYEAEIHFGESEDESDYRREFGYCKIKSAKLEEKKSGDEVPSSTNEDSDKY
ncbi:hypothetical protein GLOIN_2v1571589 [Rhizophagus irregularis DAOM 181602=DAOM 197198]|uniref:Uncharacterized protein n=1 Tax=Rhizophagus irregularis (strain DAOM 181602 / DAOM 197198 / MUCL 43194) TaxID=747089 RepID=A0A2P4QBI2_RHIID|nr:hypothetical protein GLOIN_2v1571589 [Rhizophagus irregularis DAOM 181602=DAOM 197198]POG74977.1 hypothetical protein GLOIN_2v1571589 [Rhizophagus irregularis DAOM 181602=DAOM 197198]|eukprot:XP_025181843.1 hypothetical protein GLOIN_2v1571589 [Rhizophagus irregularis DAOM 181602=DAOM 197198]